MWHLPTVTIGAQVSPVFINESKGLLGIRRDGVSDMKVLVDREFELIIHGILGGGGRRPPPRFS